MPQLTVKQAFVIGDYIELPITLTFLNRFGGWDSIHLTKYYDRDVKTNPDVLLSYNYEKVFKISSKTSTTYYTQWYTVEYNTMLEDLIHSPKVFLNGKYVKLSDHNFKVDKQEDLFRLQIETTPKFQQNFIKL